MKRITITFEEENYEYLKQRAKSHRRQPSNELNEILFNLKATQAQANDLTVEQLRQAGLNSFKLKPQATPEEQELARIKLQQKKDSIQQKRIDYFKKKYKEVFRGVSTGCVQTISYILYIIKSPNQRIA